MKRTARKLFLDFLKHRNVEMVSASRLKDLELYEKRLDLLRSLTKIDMDQKVLFDFLQLSLRCSSQSQLMQDVFALFFNKSSSVEFEEFFVEFGATDGTTLSNTYLLENEFAWKGILAEPARMWHETLLTKRKSHIDIRAVWEFTGEKMPFIENPVGELSSIVNNAEPKSSNPWRNSEYIVETVSLNDLLNCYKAPRNIGYLSVDTEGSEYEILRSFNFRNYKFGFINVEHNYSSDRENIFKLLSENGYKRILIEFSKWDDFYIPVEHPLVNYF